MQKLIFIICSLLVSQVCLADYYITTTGKKNTCVVKGFAFDELNIIINGKEKILNSSEITMFKKGNKLITSYKVIDDNSIVTSIFLPAVLTQDCFLQSGLNNKYSDEHSHEATITIIGNQQESYIQIEHSESGIPSYKRTYLVSLVFNDTEKTLKLVENKLIHEIRPSVGMPRNKSKSSFAPIVENDSTEKWEKDLRHIAKYLTKKPKLLEEIIAEKKKSATANTSVVYFVERYFNKKMKQSQTI